MAAVSQAYSIWLAFCSSGSPDWDENIKFFRCYCLQGPWTVIRGTEGEYRPV